MSFFESAVKLGQKGYSHARAEVIGIIHPNRRHDEPEEQAQDALRQQIRDGHRFTSFAPDREGNTVKWHIDGHDYMWALSEMIDQAKEAIFILDWWLTPELYLRRPPAKFPEWRLDRLLQRKAQQGVKVHVIVYKEVTQTMSMSSKHTKHALEDLHPNIACMRHPDHIGAKDSVQFWSHHEKVVVVDNHFAAIGGLDLCFGRWDTHTHPLTDVHPTDFSQTLFPGQDYNNARIMDFKEVGNYINTGLSILENPRMPWHDVHMTFTGRSVLDVSQHFIERWNEIKKRKYRDAANVEWLALPHDDAEPVVRHPHREYWKSVGRKYAQRWHLTQEEEREERREEQQEGSWTRHPRPHGTCNVQVVRSVSDWSHGVLTEDTIQRAYIDLIERSEHFIYIENQFFISSTKEGGVVKNLIAKALVDRIVRAGRDGKHFKVIITIPEVPGFAGDVKAGSSIKTIMAAQYRTINRGGGSIYEEVRKAGFEPLDYIRFYHLRSYDRFNAPLESFIKRMEEQSGVRFHEAQVALARQWVEGDHLTSQKEVQLTLPQETTEGIVISDKNAGGPKTETIPLPVSFEEARKIIARFERGADSLRGDDKVADNVAQHMLSDKTSLLDETWLGSEQEELNCYVSELLYIHSKVMIVDDRKVIMGSANINDRSQKGDGDSEIALVVEDRDLIDSYMDGQPYKAGRFAATLRRKIFREHLGLIPPQLVGDDQHRVTDNMRPSPIPNEDDIGKEEDDAVVDPLSSSMQSLWNDTAKKNREIFTEIFRPVPTNLVRDWAAYDNYVPKVKPGHVVPGIDLSRVKNRLSLVRGALVECPLDFLIDDKEFVEGVEWKVPGVNPTLPIFI